jgi:hypothetical protein
MVLIKLVISKAARMDAKYLLKHRLPFQYDSISRNLERISLIPFQYDSISRNLERISLIRFKTVNQIFGLGFKAGQARRKGTRRGRHCHPINLSIIPQGCLL